MSPRLSIALSPLTRRPVGGVGVINIDASMRQDQSQRRAAARQLSLHHLRVWWSLHQPLGVSVTNFADESVCSTANLSGARLPFFCCPSRKERANGGTFHGAVRSGDDDGTELSRFCFTAILQSDWVRFDRGPLTTTHKKSIDETRMAEWTCMWRAEAMKRPSSEGVIRSTRRMKLRATVTAAAAASHPLHQRPTQPQTESAPSEKDPKWCFFFLSPGL